MSRRPHYNHVQVTLTPTPPPPKTRTTPTYRLERYTIRRNVKTVNVQLHGLQANEKRTESMSFPLLPNVADAELVLAAVFFSPNKWSVHFGMNVSQFQGHFSKPLDAGLLNALTSKKQAQSTTALAQPPPLHSQPTVSNTSSFQQQYQPPIPQPGQFHHPFLQTPQPPIGARGRRQGIWQWYTTRTRKMQIGLAGAVITALICFSAIANAAVGNGIIPTPQATSTPAQQAVGTGDIPTPVSTLTQPSPTPAPTHQPTPSPTPKPAVAPTQPPQPTQAPHTSTPCPGINCNPWGFNFNAGKLIYSPPSAFL